MGELGGARVGRVASLRASLTFLLVVFGETTRTPFLNGDAGWGKVSGSDSRTPLNLLWRLLNVKE